MLSIVVVLALHATPIPPVRCPAFLAQATRPAASRAGALPLEECRSAYEALHAENDRAACVALWRANPHWVAVVLASDVEAGFALLESGKTGAEADARLQRALWGARRAGEAGLPLVTDYVAALAGLDEHRRTLYRQAQSIYERAMTTYQDGELDLALTIARESVERTLDLGDAWGAAMAYTTLGECHRGLSSFDDALIAFANARTLYHGLGLLQSEHATLVSMATMANVLERDVRGRELVRAALALGDRLGALVGDYDVAAQRVELLALRAGMEERLGDTEAAAATRRELEALRSER